MHDMYFSLASNAKTQFNMKYFYRKLSIWRLKELELKNSFFTQIINQFLIHIYKLFKCDFIYVFTPNHV